MGAPARETCRNAVVALVHNRVEPVLAQQGRELEEQPPIVAGVSRGEAPGQLNTVSTGLHQVGSPLRRRFSSTGLGSPATQRDGRHRPSSTASGRLRLHPAGLHHKEAAYHSQAASFTRNPLLTDRRDDLGFNRTARSTSLPPPGLARPATPASALAAASTAPHGPTHPSRGATPLPGR